MAGEVRWQFLSVAEQQQIHIFFFLWPPEQIHILPRKPPCHLHPPNSTQLPPSPSPLGAGFWLWAGCGVAEDSAGQRGRVERVTAWRGLNIWDGTDMLMYTTHLILCAKNIPSLQLSLRARANKVFTCDIILLTVCKTKNTSSVCILRQLSVGHPFTYLETESLGMFFLKFRIWPFFPVLWQGATEQGRRMSSSKRKDWRRGLWTLWCKKSFTLIKQLRSDLICETLTFDHTSLILAEICFCVNGEPGWGRLSEWGVRRSCKTKSLFLGGCSARITWCP